MTIVALLKGELAIGHTRLQLVGRQDCAKADSPLHERDRAKANLLEETDFENLDR